MKCGSQIQRETLADVEGEEVRTGEAGTDRVALVVGRGAVVLNVREISSSNAEREGEKVQYLG